MNIKYLIFGLCIFFVCSSNVLAGEIVLTVHGPGNAGEIAFSENEIRSLPSVTFATFDPWDNKKRTYKGCTILTLLEKLGRAKKCRIVEVIAKNDYRAKITLDEIITYKYLLSYEMDGKDYSELGEENKGPLAIAVKMERIENSDRMRVKNQLVWWIERLILK